MRCGRRRVREQQRDALLDRSLWARFVFSVVMGGIFLLALHTSHVRGRWIRIVSVLAVFTVSLNVVLAIAVGHDSLSAKTVLLSNRRPRGRSHRRWHSGRNTVGCFRAPQHPGLR